MSNRIREHFGNIDEVVEAPNLIGIQIQSYADFLQQDVAPSKRKQVGLQAVFKDCLLYTSPSPRDKRQSRMPSSA